MKHVTITPNTTADHIIQLDLQYTDMRANVQGKITVFKKHGYMGTMDEALFLCPKTGCKGIIFDVFEFTLAERDEIEKLGPDKSHISFWPEAARLRYDTWDKAIVTCPICKTSEARYDLAEAYGFSTTIDRVAVITADFFRIAGDSCDILMYIHQLPGGLHKAKQDLHDVGNKHQFKKDLEKARERHTVFYQLDAIIKDTSAGAKLENRILALLKG